MITRRISFSLVLLIAAHCGDAVAQETRAKYLGPDPEDVKEVFQTEVPVSGRVVAGITATSSTAMAALAVYAKYDRVCIEVVSRDGRFWSRNTYDLTSPVQDWPVPVEYRSAHMKYLDKLDANDLAVLGSPGECGGDGGDGDKGYYIMGSGPPNDRPESIRIFVNSGRMDTYVATVSGGERGRTSRCDPIDAKRRTGFDAICEVSLAKIAPDESKLTIQILRRRYDRTLPTTELIVVLPDAK